MKEKEDDYIKEKYLESLVEENNNSLFYKLIPGIIILFYFVFSDSILRNNIDAVYTRIVPIILAIFLLLHYLFNRKKYMLFRLRLYHVFLASLPIMMYWKCIVHINEGLASAVSGTILVFFIVSLDIKTNKINTLIIYFIPFIIFLFLFFPLIETKEQVITVANILPIVIIGYIVNRLQNKLRFNSFKANYLLFYENQRAEQLYEEVCANNESLIAQKEEIVQQHNKITQINEKLEYTNSQIHESILYAYQIQRILLPNDAFIKKYFSDFFIFYAPRDIVSGDFYWFEKIDKTIYIAAVDCTGHGVPAAFLSILGSSILYRAVHESKLQEPADIIRFLGNELQMLFSRNMHNENIIKDGMDLVLCAFDEETKNLKYAGVNSSFLVCSNDTLQEYTTTKIDIRNVSNETIKQDSIQLHPGDIIYLFSDGYKDQFGGQNNKKYLKRNFYKTLYSIKDAAGHIQQKKLEIDFNVWKNNNEQTDDVLVIGFRT